MIREVPSWALPFCFLVRMIILRKPVAGLSETTLARFIARACRVAGLAGVVNVLVTSNRELHALNLRFRGKDCPTDVLSFPPMPGLIDGLAGDVAISADLAVDNARLLRHPPAAEIKILVLHAILHLAGYDHERDQGEMARRESGLRRSLGLPEGLIERNGQGPRPKNQGSGQGSDRTRKQQVAFHSASVPPTGKLAGQTGGPPRPR
jgi:probable rRNA maturation factor